MEPTFRTHLLRGLAVVLALFTLAEVNYPLLRPQSPLAIFALLGLVLSFLCFPLHPKVAEKRWANNHFIYTAGHSNRHTN